MPQATVLIVGGGPHGLALLSALHEKSFAFPQFSETVFQHRLGFGHMEKIGSVCVIDPGETFMAEWHKRFDALEIKHLRSPAFAHPLALEPQALVHFAVREGRTSELRNVPDVGQRLATEGTSSQDPLLFGLPSAALFKDFCTALAAQLPHEWLRGTATSVTKDESTGTYRVHYVCHSGQIDVVHADAVVLATGPAGQPNIPRPFRALVESGHVMHTDSFLKEGTLRDSMPSLSRGGARVLVVGGGLTAAQAALSAVAAGGRVVLRSRRPLQTRAYDISADWLDGRHANRLRFQFLSTNPEARAQFVKKVVQGGSVPEAYIAELRRLASTTDLLEVQADEDVDRSAVALLEDGKVRVNGEEFDNVILATGVLNAPMSFPLYQQVQAEFGAPTLNGLPHVDEALRWAKSEDLFVLGANAVLELGPGALNLMGAMRGAQIVATELRDLMWATKHRTVRLAAAVTTNRFSLLLNDDESDDSNDESDASIE